MAHAHRVRVLLLTQRLPYAANRGDRIRARGLLEQLATFAEVDLVSLVHSRDEAAHAGELGDLCQSVHVGLTSRWRGYARAVTALPSHRPLTHALLDSPALPRLLRRLVAERRPDVVVSGGSGVARFAVEPPLAGLPHVLDMVDVDSEKWRALAIASPYPMRAIYRLEARRLAAFEARTSLGARAVLLTTDREREALLRIAPGAPVHVLPNGIALDTFAPQGAPADSQDVTFCGVMDYAPNEQAALWFAHNAWPQVRAARPAARFLIVGMNPTDAVRRLPEHDPSIVVTGAVDDVRPYLWAAAVSVAPLRVARGVQNKVLEALAAGLPCVVTPAVAEGLPPAVRQACAVATSGGEFASRVGAWLDQPAQARRTIAAAAPLEPLTWTAQLAPLQGIIERARNPTAELPGA